MDVGVDDTLDSHDGSDRVFVRAVVVVHATATPGGGYGKPMDYGGSRSRLLGTRKEPIQAKECVGLQKI